MVYQLSFIFSAIAALAPLVQSVAVITNHCKTPIYVWSIPGDNQGRVIQPGGQYSEQFRYGGEVNPGIALKVSSQFDGIYQGKDELEFQYTVDPKENPTHVWLKLHTVRAPESGLPYEGGVYFSDCIGGYREPFVETRKCGISSLTELALCSSGPSMPKNATKPAPRRNHWKRNACSEQLDTSVEDEHNA